MKNDNLADFYTWSAGFYLTEAEVFADRQVYLAEEFWMLSRRPSLPWDFTVFSVALPVLRVLSTVRDVGFEPACSSTMSHHIFWSAAGLPGREELNDFHVYLTEEKLLTVQYVTCQKGRYPYMLGYHTWQKSRYWMTGWATRKARYVLLIHAGLPYLAEEQVLDD